jgi:bifunctional non-homologous end joining protein LigD
MHGRAGEGKQASPDGGGGEPWLLIKETDDQVRRGKDDDILTRRPESVASGRSMDDIASAADRVWHSKPRNPPPARDWGAKKLDGAAPSALPATLAPQLATPSDSVPDGDDWLHEIKLDGYRLLARIEGGRVRLFTRQGNDWTDRFPTLARLAANLALRSAWLDGEVVSLDAHGRSSFAALQEALSRKDDSALVYYAFDLPYLDGADLRVLPLAERKSLLARVLRATPQLSVIRFGDHVAGNGSAFLAEASRFGLEGIVAKRATSHYRSTRTRDWLKIKCARRQEFVIGGFTEPAGARPGFGALLLGTYAEGELVYAGRVGTGFDDRQLADLRARLDALARKRSPFAKPVADAPRDVHWVEPRLVAEVRFANWTRDEQLRHATFLGLREDKAAREVVRESVAPPPVSAPAPPASPAIQARGSKNPVVAGVRLTNPDRVLYPEESITKLELALFYEKIGHWVLPHLALRPLTVVRCPEGYQRECFYQKHMNATVPKDVRSLPIMEDGREVNYLMIDSLAGLISCVQMGALELHTWGTHHEHLATPDQIVFDLDPDPALGFEQVMAAAQMVRECLTAVGLVSFVKTTGGKGLHVMVPVRPKLTWAPVKDFAKRLADVLVREAPARFTTTMTKSQRKGKIFIDYLRNGEGATAVAAYSTRARTGAPVSVPLGWDELQPGLTGASFTVRNLAARLERLTGDPWEGYGDVRQTISPTTLKKLERLEP